MKKIHVVKLPVEQVDDLEVIDDSPKLTTVKLSTKLDIEEEQELVDLTASKVESEFDQDQVIADFLNMVSKLSINNVDPIPVSVPIIEELDEQPTVSVKKLTNVKLTEAKEPEPVIKITPQLVSVITKTVQLTNVTNKSDFENLLIKLQASGASLELMEVMQSVVGTIIDKEGLELDYASESDIDDLFTT